MHKLLTYKKMYSVYSKFFIIIFYVVYIFLCKTTILTEVT